jgi:hypothetical protein
MFRATRRAMVSGDPLAMLAAGNYRVSRPFRLRHQMTKLIYTGTND